MIQRYEFRVFEQYRDLFGSLIPSWLQPSYGMLILRGKVGDAVFKKLAEIETELEETKLEGIFAGWKIRTSYTANEIRRAELFLLDLPITHISAEDYGTKYTAPDDCWQESFDFEFLDPSGSNLRAVERRVPCGLCSRQAGPLCVPVHKLPKSRSIYRLFGGELVVSDQLASLLDSGGFSGGELCPVSTCGGAAPAREAFQLTVKSKPLELSAETRFGGHPFDTKSQGYFRCKSGEIAGNSLISPLKVLRQSWDGSDLCRTRVHISGRQGPYRPYQPLVVSRRLFLAMRDAAFKGFEFQIAELV